MGETGPTLTHSISPRGILLISLSTVVWSFTAIFIQPLVTTYGMTPLAIAAWRLFLATPVLALVVAGRRVSFRISRGEIALYFATGTSGVLVSNILWSASVQVNHAAVATALFYCSPAFVVVAAHLLFHERFGPVQVVAVLVSLAGCVLVAGITRPIELVHNPHGLELGLASGAAFATYTLFSRGAARRWARDSLVALFWVFLFAALVSLAVGLPIEGARLVAPRMSQTGWALLVGLALGPSLGGYMLFTAALRFVPAGVASLFLTLEPAITAGLAAVFLGKTLVGVQWDGMVLIVASVFLMQLRQGPAWQRRRYAG